MTDLDQLTDKFYQTFKYEIILILHKYFENTDEEELLSTCCMRPM